MAVYTYTVDNANLAVQDLSTGESLTDIFTYTITDSDGDTATTTLTITIDGVNDGAQQGAMKSKSWSQA
ncbi:Hypothetical protein FKW44_025160 [Caligus rogercresseyi]|uniref:Uncharacterized protein n=1 Tax=Caligus rogercresseyi TaxID=217165 RepID=A0A7T8GL50_CALRO|nr:Hypothetical protein FKW44_025160 [Caligus rogercresseyi]